MKKVAVFSALLVAGLMGARFLPDLAGPWFPLTDEIGGKMGSGLDILR